MGAELISKTISSADDIKSEQLVCDRSTLVNPKMVNEAKYLEASADEYKGYLVILIDGHMYLANSRSVFRTTSGYEYDWFYFDSIRVKENDEYSNAKIVKVIDRNMFFGTEHGHICMFDEDITNDNGEILHSYYTTVSDVFDHINHLKTTSKRGGLLKLKAVPNSSVKMAVRTNVKKDWKDIAEYKNNGFSFENFQFDNFTFLLNEGENYLVIKNKQKKFSEIQYKIYSNELDKPFGFFSLTIEAFVGGYIKK